MNTLQEKIQGIYLQTNRPSSLRLFSILLYSWLLLYLLWNLPVHELIWGRSSFNMPIVAPPGVFQNIYYFLVYNGPLSKWVLIVHGIACFLAIFGRLGVVPRILVYITGAMLYNAGYLAYNGGYILCWLMSFYLIFADSRGSHPIRNVLNNIAITACMMQVMLVYGVAAWFKWQGNTWLEGSSVYYTLQMEHFSPAGIGKWLSQFYWLMLILNYAGLFYQSLFPIVVLFKRFRTWWLLTGLGFHLFIIIVMGLWDFGLAMIISYAVFLDEEKSARILKKFGIRNNQSKASTIRSIV